MDYLPLGSVVTLKNSTEKLMIIGVNQKAIDGGNEFDYCGCLSPYGYINGDSLFLFNNDRIEKVHFEGYVDEDIKDYYEDLAWLKSVEKEKQNNE